MKITIKAINYIILFLSVDPSNQLLQKMENLQMLAHPTRAIELLFLGT